MLTLHNRLLRCALLLGAAYLFARFLFLPLLPFLIAMAMAVLLEPWVQRLRRRLGWRRGFTAVAVTTVLLAAVLSASWWLLVTLFQEAVGCLEHLPQALGSLPGLVDSLEERYAGLYDACPSQVRQWLDTALEHLSQQGLTLVQNLSTGALNWASGVVSQLPAIFLFLATTILAIYFTALSYPEIAAFIRHQMPRRWHDDLTRVATTLRSTCWKWLKAESLLCFLTFCMLLAGFWYLKIDYVLLTALLVAVVDALPVLGAGTVLVPWGIYQLALGSVPQGVALLALYAIITLVRSLMEPRIMAAQAGLPRLTALLAMYLGFTLLGVGGMFLLPILLLFVKQLQDAGLIHLWK